MAVFQISRIQIRRGQANQGTGLPQLASGEMAWAIDTQELYIGNGSVSEGAPAVGNTKILTQNDLAANGNLLGVIKYVYKTLDSTITTGPSSNSPVYRSMQERLDDTVNAFDFGATGNGHLVTVNDPTSGYTGTDDTKALQRAINELFMNSTVKASSLVGVDQRVELVIPAGVYITTKPLYIPSYATIKGAGQEKTIIYYNPVSTFTATITSLSTTVPYTSADASMVGATITGTGIPYNTTVMSVNNGVSMILSNAATASGSYTFTMTKSAPAIQFVNDNSSISNSDISTVNVSNITNTTSTTQPRYIKLSGLTVYTPTGKNTGMQLDAVRDSTFDDIRLQGDWNNTVHSLSVGISLNAFSTAVTCENNEFTNFTIEKFSYAVHSYHNINNNHFLDFDVSNGYQGFVLGHNIVTNTQSTGSAGTNQEFGPRLTTIVDAKFSNIKRHAVYVGLGTGNLVSECKYVNVGANGGGNVVGPATYPQVYFNTYGNRSENSYSDREVDFVTENTSIPYIPEVAGRVRLTSDSSKPIAINNFITPQFGFRLPVSTTGLGVPAGTILYTIDYLYNSTYSAFARNGVLTIAADIDNAVIQLSDDYEFAGVDPDFSIAPALEFSVKFFDASGAVYTGAGGQVPYSIAVYYKNTLANDYGQMFYSYTALS